MRPRKNNKNLPPCMYLKSGRYYYVKAGKWHSLSKNYGEAMAEYARLTAPGGGIADLMDRTLEHASIAASTRVQYEMVAERVKSAFREFDPSQVRPKHIYQLMDHYRSTPSMANRMRSFLKVAFSNAVRWGLAETNPATEIEPFKERGRDRYLEDDEYLAIRKKARRWLAIAMDLSYLTGQRPGDVLGIKESDITDEEIRFRQQKTGQRVAIEMNEAIWATIAAARALHRVRGVYLLHKGNGKPYSGFTLSDAFRRARIAAKVDDAQFRDIRAKSATDAEESGLNPTLLLGHTNAGTTKRYLRKKRTIRASGPTSFKKF